VIAGVRDLLTYWADCMKGCGW